MDNFTVLYIIIGFCCCFAVISAYLIYVHVQDEKREYYRNKLRREKAQEGPSSYAKSEAEGNTRKPLIAPVVAPVGKKPLPAEPKPVPPSDAPIPHEPAPVPVLPSNGHAPEIKEAPPADTSFGGQTTAGATLLGGAAIAGAAVTGAAVVTNTRPVMTTIPPPPSPQLINEKPQEEKRKKKKHKHKTSPVSDFDDYRNCSPTALPPAKPAPAPAQYNYPADHDGPILKSRERLPLDLPPLPPDSREGLNF